MGFINLISKLFFPENGTATRNSAKAIPTEGCCGEQIEWKFIPGERELRISGTGATYEFVRTKDVPWEAFVSQIQKISVEEGVTSLGSRLFRYCNILEEVSLPHSLRQIGQHCFAYCSNLASIHLPEGLSSIDKYAFSYCTSLQELTLPASLPKSGSRLSRIAATSTTFISFLKLRKSAVPAFPVAQALPASGFRKDLRESIRTCSRTVHRSPASTSRNQSRPLKTKPSKTATGSKQQTSLPPSTTSANRSSRAATVSPP